MSAFHRLHALRMENDARGYEMEEQRPRFQKLAARHENGTAPRAVVAYQLFQTPPELAARLVAMLGQPERVLEPSAGLGRLLDALPPVETVAIEVAPQCAGELFQQDRPGVKILQRDFLTVTPEETGLFDAVAMNPPFHMRADIQHVLHALNFLRPGGRLAALVMDTRHRWEALKPLADFWEPIPEKTFRAEGTDVACVLLRITR